jgi:hypothetical protein
MDATSARYNRDHQKPSNQIVLSNAGKWLRGRFAALRGCRRLGAFQTAARSRMGKRLDGRSDECTIILYIDVAHV